MQVGGVRAGTIRGKPPLGTRVNTQQPDPSDIYKRVRRAWDTYRLADRTRTEASAEVTTELAAARAAGISMYRMAIWLGVTQRAIKERLEKHDQTNTPPPPT